MIDFDSILTYKTKKKTPEQPKLILCKFHKVANP